MKKLKNKIVIPIFILISITSFLVLFINFSRQKVVLENNYKEGLESIITSRSHHLDTFIKSQKEKILMMASSSIFKQSLNSKIPDFEKNKEIACQRLYKLVDTEKNIYHLSILDSSGEVVCSTQDNYIGKDLSSLSAFKFGKEQAFIGDFNIDYEYNNTNFYFISAPLTCSFDLCPGVILGRAKINPIEEIIYNRTNLDETTRLYLTNKDGIVINSPWPDLGFSENYQDESINTKNCLNHFSSLEEGELLPHSYEDSDKKHLNSFIDSRGISVIGSHHPSHQKKWCLIGQIDQSQIITPVNQNLMVGLVIFLIFIIITYIITTIVANRISNSIKSIQSATEIISSGNLNYKIKKISNDEIGQLANFFNKMVDDIKKSKSEINKKVLIQTKKIQNQFGWMNNQQKAILNILEDIDQEKELAQEDRDRLSIILQSIGDGVFVVDKELNIVIFNKIASNISGYSIEETIGKKYDQILKFINEKNNKINDEFIKETISTGQSKNMANHTQLIRKDGSKIAVADSASPLKNKEGKVIGCVVVFRDVTKEREVDRMKTDFISLASHQLRTPLSAMRWFSEMLLAGDAGKLNKEQTEFAQNISESNQRLIDLVNGLLNISRIESGRIIIDPKPTDIKKLIDGVISEIKPSLDDKHQQLTFSVRHKTNKINIDSKLVRNVYLNLLTNAIKYTLDKGKISILVSETEKEIITQITDTGLGIPEKEQEKIFTRFFRATNVIKNETDGTGLGLYLAKAIAESSGGKLWFKSEQGKGTTFWFSLPLAGSKFKKGEVAIDS
jgi:PAS domain S-box-containing protein